MLVAKEFYSHYVRLPENEVPPEIFNNPKFFPFFKDCRGATDGSLLHAFVDKLAMSRYRCRRDLLQQIYWLHGLFNLRFCYILLVGKEVLLIHGCSMKPVVIPLKSSQELIILLTLAFLYVMH